MHTCKGKGARALTRGAFLFLSHFTSKAEKHFWSRISRFIKVGRQPNGWKVFR